MRSLPFSSPPPIRHPRSEAFAVSPLAMNQVAFPKASKLSFAAQRKGFTLIELLVTIGLIVLLFGVVANFSSGLSRGQSVSAGVNVISSQLALARNLAASRSVPAAVLIYEKATPDFDELDYQLRYVQVVYLGEDSSGNPQWIPEGNGISLPKGVYFQAEFSAGEVRLNDLPSGSVDGSGNAETISAAPPSLGKGIGTLPAEQWYAYGFSSTGAPLNQTENDRLDLILQGRAAVDGDGNLVTRKENLKHVGGLSLSRYGNAIPYRDAAQINQLTTVELIEP